MSNTPLNCQPRTNSGKGASRELRRQGRVPAVIYGDKKQPTLISLDPRDIIKELNKNSFFTTIYSFDADNVQEKAIAKDIQFHPITDIPTHVDFLRVSEKTTVNVFVPFDFINETSSPGMKKGGVLNIVHHEIEVTSKADAIPHDIKVDLADKEIGHIFHLKDIALPEGCEFTTKEKNYTVATLLAPRVSTASDDEENAAESK